MTTSSAARQTSNPLSFGDALRELRESVGMTQTDLSQASGISQSTVSALETGKQRPWPSTRRALARAFSMSLEQLDVRLMPGARRMTEPPHLAGSVSAADSPLLAPAGDSAGRGAEVPASLMRLLEQTNQIQDRLRRSELELGLIRRLIDDMPILMWEVGADLRVVTASGWAAKRYACWSDLVGRTLGEFHERSKGRIPLPPIEPHTQALGGRPVSIVLPWDGREWTVALEPIRNARGDVTGVLGLAVPRGLAVED